MEQGNSMLSSQVSHHQAAALWVCTLPLPVSVTKLYLKTAQMSHFVCKVPTCMAQTHCLWLPIHLYEVIQNTAYMKQLFLYKNQLQLSSC